jgi:hypothetical protein
MIQFDWTDDQKMMQESIRSFGKKEIVPLLRKMDEEKRIPGSVIKRMAGEISAEYCS